MRKPEPVKMASPGNSFFTDFGGTPLTFWISVAVICLILGTFIEIIPVFYLTVPIFAALALSLGQDILHLYVVFSMWCLLRSPG